MNRAVTAIIAIIMEHIIRTLRFALVLPMTHTVTLPPGLLTVIAYAHLEIR